MEEQPDASKSIISLMQLSPQARHLFEAATSIQSLPTPALFFRLLMTTVANQLRISSSVSVNCLEPVQFRSQFRQLAMTDRA
jgi:hypothetical protein